MRATAAIRLKLRRQVGRILHPITSQPIKRRTSTSHTAAMINTAITAQRQTLPYFTPLQKPEKSLLVVKDLFCLRRRHGDVGRRDRHDRLEVVGGHRRHPH